MTKTQEMLKYYHWSLILLMVVQFRLGTSWTFLQNNDGFIHVENVKVMFPPFIIEIFPPGGNITGGICWVTMMTVVMIMMMMMMVMMVMMMTMVIMTIMMTMKIKKTSRDLSLNNHWAMIISIIIMRRNLFYLLNCKSLIFYKLNFVW